MLRRGLNGYGGVSDTFLDRNLPTTVRGSFNPLYLDSANYTPLIRFAVFQSEGGPVPNGATIQSATLQLYKQYYNDTVRLNALLKPWIENQATWQLQPDRRDRGAALGASGVGSDYSSSADAVISVPFNPGWVSFDVSARVRQWATNTSTNFGWRLGSTGRYGKPKTFNASEYRDRSDAASDADDRLSVSALGSAPAESARRSHPGAQRPCASARKSGRNTPGDRRPG